MTPEDLVFLWTQLPIPSAEGLLEARTMPDTVGLWAARDRSGRFHLLVEVPSETRMPSVTTHGMRVGAGVHQVADHEPAQFIDLANLETAMEETFAAVAAEIGNAVREVDLTGRPAVVEEAMARWQWFWDVDPDQLSAQDALGLFGELWFILRWVGATPGAVNAWTASDPARHDMQWPEVSVEIKTAATQGNGGTLHRIVSLDQLADPESGQLLLFSLRVARDRLAANTLPMLVDRITGMLPPQARHDFEHKLSRRGYSPANRRRYETTYRLIEEHLYTVDAAFPRLTRASLGNCVPNGVNGISYLLDTVACESHLFATSPRDWNSPERP